MLKFQCLAFFAEIETRVSMVKLPSLSVVGTVEPPADDHLSTTVTYFLAPTNKKIHGLTLV